MIATSSSISTSKKIINYITWPIQKKENTLLISIPIITFIASNTLANISYIHSCFLASATFLTAIFIAHKITKQHLAKVSSKPSDERARFVTSSLASIPDATFHVAPPSTIALRALRIQLLEDARRNWPSKSASSPPKPHRKNRTIIPSRASSSPFDKKARTMNSYIINRFSRRNQSETFKESKRTSLSYGLKFPAPLGESIKLSKSQLMKNFILLKRLVDFTDYNEKLKMVKYQKILDFFKLEKEDILNAWQFYLEQEKLQARLKFLSEKIDPFKKEFFEKMIKKCFS